MILSIFCFLLLSLTELVMAQAPLEFATAKDLRLEDSIPLNTDEKVVKFNRGLQAHWVIVLVTASYDDVTTSVREIIEKGFGVEYQKELKSTVDSTKLPQDIVFGAGGVDFRLAGIRIKEGREFRIDTKPYNRDGEKIYSRAVWRVIDGKPLFAKGYCLLVVGRTDYSREWAVMHPGIPLPFKISTETKIVTNTETKVIENVLKKLGQSSSTYFVLPNPGFASNQEVDLMRKIIEAAKKLQKQ